MQLISVIMPVYNAEKWLHTSIESILSQTYSSLEFIIIDDGSTDKSIDIIGEYLKKDNRIRLIRNLKNFGIVNSLNKAIEASKGIYIARQDADDLSHPQRLEIQMNLITAKGYDLLGTKAIVFNKHMPIFKQLQDNKLNIYLPKLDSGNTITHGSILTNRELLFNNKYDENYLYAEDTELWLRLQRKGFKLGIIDEKLYAYYRPLFNKKSFEYHISGLKVKKKYKLIKFYNSNKFIFRVFKYLYYISNYFDSYSYVCNYNFTRTISKLLSFLFYPIKILNRFSFFDKTNI